MENSFCQNFFFPASFDFGQQGPMGILWGVLSVFSWEYSMPSKDGATD